MIALVANHFGMFAVQCINLDDGALLAESFSRSTVLLIMKFDYAGNTNRECIELLYMAPLW